MNKMKYETRTTNETMLTRPSRVSDSCSSKMTLRTMSSLIDLSHHFISHLVLFFISVLFSERMLLMQVQMRCYTY